MNEKKRLDMQQGDLSDRQSIRTTFRFSKEALEALCWLSVRYGVSMKDVLHSALEQITETSEPEKDHRRKNELSTNLGIGVILANPTNSTEIKNIPEKTIRRTVVVTKKTLTNLTKLSKKFNITRDDLINKAIVCAKSFTDIYDKSQIEIYRESLNLIDNFYIEAQGVETQLKELLGHDDLIVEEFELAITMIMDTSMKIEEEIKKREKN